MKKCGQSRQNWLPKSLPISHEPRPYHAELSQPVPVQPIENIQPDFFRYVFKTARFSAALRQNMLRFSCLYLAQLRRAPAVCQGASALAARLESSKVRVQFLYIE